MLKSGAALTGHCLPALVLLSPPPSSALSNVLCLCVNQIVGNGSEQQLQRELEDVLMDPSVADADLGMERPAPPPPTASDSPTTPPSNLEIVLPVQTAQESELNERSYRGEPVSSAAEPQKCLTLAVPTCRRRVVLRRQPRQPHPKRGQRGVQPAHLSGLCVGQRPPQRGGGPAYDEHPQGAVPAPSGCHPVRAGRVRGHRPVREPFCPRL